MLVHPARLPRGNMKHGVSCLLRVRRNVVILPLSEQSRDIDCVQPWLQSTASVSDDDFARTSRTNMRMLRVTRRVAVPDRRASCRERV